MNHILAHGVTRYDANRCIRYSSDTNFVVSSPQVILLKFLDGYLQLPQHSDSRPTPSIVDFILREFTHLSTAMLRQDRPKDGRDAATFQGLVLLLQCIITIGLGTKEGRSIDLNPIIEEIVGESERNFTLTDSG